MNSLDFNEWDNNNYEKLILYLKQISDEKYLNFNSKLIFTNYKMLGVRTPLLRNIAKKIAKGDFFSYLDTCKNYYYEEIMLQGILIGYIKDVDLFLKYFNNFIYYIDNWAICDMTISNMRIVKRNKSLFLDNIKEYVNNSNPFVVRVGIVLLLNFYIEKQYLDEIFIIIDNINSDEYYVNMAIAWLVSICFIRYRDETLIYLNNCHLNKFTYNKSLQKARESLRISDSDKVLLQDMKIR